MNKLPYAQAELHKRAAEQMKAWRKTLTDEGRTKLKGDLSLWALKGGNLITPRALRTPRRKRKRTRPQEVVGSE